MVKYYTPQVEPLKMANLNTQLGILIPLSWVYIRVLPQLLKTLLRLEI